MRRYYTDAAADIPSGEGIFGYAEAKGARLFATFYGNPAYADVGTGNIKIFTAVRLIDAYIADHPSSDPIDLKKYDGNILGLVNDLLDPMSPTTVQIASLQIREAYDFGKSHFANWAMLSEAEQEAFAIAYYRSGRAFFEGKYGSGGVVNFDPSGLWDNPGARFYLENRQVVLDILSRERECFPAHTHIQTSLTTSVAISTLLAGDIVLSYDARANNGRGALVPRRVVRIYRNTTSEWVRLTWVEGGERRELVATPGHHFLDQFGQRAVGCVLARTIAVSALPAASPKARRVQARALPLTGNLAEAL